jgi:hypothetical protein
MSREYKYEPADKPIVGGWAATFAAGAREFGRDTAKKATKRVLEREPYVLTGDTAFDLRAAAFRDALMAGADGAFAESYYSFVSVGL